LLKAFFEDMNLSDMATFCPDDPGEGKTKIRFTAVRNFYTVSSEQLQKNILMSKSQDDKTDFDN